LIQRDGLWSLTQKQDGLSTMERSSEKNSDLRSQANCEGEDSGVKGQDERQNAAPLTPESSPQEIPAMFCKKHAKKEY
jgi:hypothetical protein